jgi:hypothetical protein
VADSAALLVALADYRTARRRFLELLGCAPSNRDPLAEFAERLAQTVLGGEIAANRVQKAYDLVTAEGETVQVRYLANPARRWVNGHVVDFRSGVDLYALLIVEDLDAKVLLVFTRSGLPGLCTAFAKRHAEAGTTFQFLEANYRAMAASPARYQALGLTFVDLRSSLASGLTNAIRED